VKRILCSFDFRDYPTQIHEFGWGVRGHEQMIFTNSEDATFCGLLQEHAAALLSLFAGGVVCRHHLRLNLLTANKYEVAVTYHPFSGREITPGKERELDQVTATLMGERMGKAIGWAKNFELDLGDRFRIAEYIPLHLGAHPPILWQDTIESKRIRVRESAKGLRVFIPEPPHALPFRAVAKRMRERLVYDSIRMMPVLFTSVAVA
jgi:hypothetical protein